MSAISVVIITRNAERYLRQVLSSAAFADETVVVDSGSTDSTLSVCREFGVRIIERAWTGYASQKNFAIEQAAGPWILSLDADEVVSPGLAEEIVGLVRREGPAGYRIPRRNHYFGRWLRRGGQYPDLQLRLFKKGAGAFNITPIHESVAINGPVGRTKGHLDHYTYDTLADYFDKFGAYTSLQAEKLAAERGTPPQARLFLDLAVRPVWKFVWRYFFKLGFADGVPGFLAALFNSLSLVVSHAKCWEKSGADSGGAE